MRCCSLQRAALAEVVIDLKTMRPPLNNNDGGDTDVEDVLYHDRDGDINLFGFTNMSKI